MKARLIDKVNSREFILNQGETKIGREKDNDIVLEDGAVSKRHAWILCRGNECRLFDLNSINGTKVNGQYIDKRILRDEDLIEFGNTKFHFSKSTDFSGNRKPILPVIAALVAIIAIIAVWYVTFPKAIKVREGKKSPDSAVLYKEGMKDYMNRDRDIVFLKSAIEKWNRAIELSPDSGKIRKSIDTAESELVKKAKELYISGKRLYDKGNIKGAVDSWRSVQEITDRESELWQMAEEGISKEGKDR